MDNATLVTIISTVIGTGAAVITLNMIFILKFVKEPLDNQIDRLEDNLQSQINNLDNQIDRSEDNLQYTNLDKKVDNKIDRLEDNFQSQINSVDKKVDKLYELLLAHHMNDNK